MKAHLAPVQVIHSGNKHRVAGSISWVLASELQPLPTSWVSHEGRLVLVWKTWQINAALSCTQRCCGQCIPVGVSIAIAVALDGQGAIQVMLCCPVVWAPAATICAQECIHYDCKGLC